VSQPDKLMEKYRGPSKQYPKVERKFFIRIIVGLLILVVGVGAQNVNIALSETTVMVPGPDAGAGPQEISSGIEVTQTVGVITLLAAGVVNFRAIMQYRDEYGEIKETEPRPEMLFIGIALIVTIVAIVLAGSFILAETPPVEPVRL
tara:strand:- start:826 stop:1266 length:441 start_codon:yes stop_codon:yes gene_type:complete